MAPRGLHGDILANFHRICFCGTSGSQHFNIFGISRYLKRAWPRSPQNSFLFSVTIFPKPLSFHIYLSSKTRQPSSTTFTNNVFRSAYFPSLFPISIFSKHQARNQTILPPSCISTFQQNRNCPLPIFHQYIPTTFLKCSQATFQQCRQA
jgi:hypothetical protein